MNAYAEDIRRPGKIGFRTHLGAEGPEPIRESTSSQPLAMRFRALLTEGGTERLEFATAQRAYESFALASRYGPPLRSSYDCE
jgi:hypothetical protein